MRNFARVTKLSNVAGRGDYISNPARQESIVLASPSVDWKPYHEYEQSHQKSDKANNEGREVIIQLPNEWSELTDAELYAKADRLAVTATCKDTDMQWAVHWNKAHTNLHMHVVFSERTRTDEVKIYDRDIYQTADGRVARSKADRAKDGTGKDLPPVHRKGEISSVGFTAKDTRYKELKWTEEMKDSVKAELVKQGAILTPDREAYELHQYHQGKGAAATEIAMKNKAIETTNNKMKELAAHGAKPEFLQTIKTKVLSVLHETKFPLLYIDTDKKLHLRAATLQDIWNAKRQTQSEVSAPNIAAKTEPTPIQPPEPIRPAFDVADVARQLEAHRAEFIKAKTASSDRAAEHKTAFRSLARTVPEDKLQEVFDEIKKHRIQDERGMGMDGFKANIAAVKELDSAFTSRTQEQGKTRSQEQGHSR